MPDDKIISVGTGVTLPLSRISSNTFWATPLLRRHGARRGSSNKKAHAILALLVSAVLSYHANRILAPDHDFYYCDLGLTDAELRRIVLASPLRHQPSSAASAPTAKDLLGTEMDVLNAVKQSTELTPRQHPRRGSPQDQVFVRSRRPGRHPRQADLIVPQGGHAQGLPL